MKKSHERVAPAQLWELTSFEKRNKKNVFHDLESDLHYIKVNDINLGNPGIKKIMQRYEIDSDAENIAIWYVYHKKKTKNKMMHIEWPALYETVTLIDFEKNQKYKLEIIGISKKGFRKNANVILVISNVKKK